MDTRSSEKERWRPFVAHLPPMFLRKTLEMPGREAAVPGRDQPIRTAERHFVNGRPLKGPYPEGAQLAQFAMGCCWGVERMFWPVRGSG